MHLGVNTGCSIKNDSTLEGNHFRSDSYFFKRFSANKRYTSELLCSLFALTVGPFSVVRLDHLKRPLFWKNTTFDFQENGSVFTSIDLLQFEYKSHSIVAFTTIVYREYLRNRLLDLRASDLNFISSKLDLNTLCSSFGDCWSLYELHKS